MEIIQLAKPLTDAQTTIVMATDKNIVVAAGPGSGKSTTLVARIKKLIAQDGVDPGAIMAISFTTNAAAVLRERLGGFRLGCCSTLHSYLVRLITDHGSFIGYQTPTVLDEEAGDALLMKLAVESKCRDSLKAMRAAVLAGIPAAGSVAPIVVTVRRFYDALRADNLLVYDVMLTLGLKLIRALDEAGKDWCLFDYMMVDENQDSGDLDDEIYDALPIAHKMWVGDDSQSIFAFRGAEPANFLERAKKPGVRLFLLEQNFRSDQHVCRAANLLIRNNRDRIDKATVPVSAADGTVECIGCRDEQDELSTMAKLWALWKVSPDETAVLVRTNRLVEHYRQNLPTHGVPVVRPRYGRPRCLGDALLLIRLLADPDNDYIARQWLTKLHGEEKAAAMALEAAQHYGSLNRRFLKLHPVPIQDLMTAMPITNPHVMPTETVDLIRTKISEVGPDASLNDLLVALQDDEPSEESDEQHGVRVMTIHRAKGQEFDAVMLPAFEDQTIPGWKPEDLPEDRRLAFVAVTRARHRVLITHARERRNPYKGGYEGKVPSRFIREMGL